MTRPDTAGRTTGRSPSAPRPTSSRTPTRCWPSRGRGRRGRARRRRAAPRDGVRTDGVPGSERRVSLAHRLYNGEAGLDVVGRSRLIYKITAVVVLLCLLSMIFRGFNFGIDFEGGSSFKVPGSSEQLTEVRTAAEKAGAAGLHRAGGRRQHRAAAHRPAGHRQEDRR